MPGKFVVSLTCAKNDADKATVAFVVANAAVASDKQTLVFLSIEGTRLSQRGYADEISEPGFAPLDLLEWLVPRYEELLVELKSAGAQWVQIDEPILVTDQPAEVLERVREVYERLGALAERPKILVASYFDRLGDALSVLAATPIDGLAMDFTGPAAANLQTYASFSAGTTAGPTACFGLCARPRAAMQ